MLEVEQYSGYATFDFKCHSEFHRRIREDLCSLLYLLPFIIV